MARNWFYELGLDKVAAIGMPQYPSTDFMASLSGGGGGGAFPGLAAGGAMARYDPRVARFHEAMNRLRDYFGRGAGGARPVNITDITPQAAPSVAQSVSSAVSKGTPLKASQSMRWLARLFPKGSGSAFTAGALIPLGLLLASRLFMPSGPSTFDPPMGYVPPEAERY